MSRLLHGAQQACTASVAAAAGWLSDQLSELHQRCPPMAHIRTQQPALSLIHVPDGASF